MAKPFVSFLLFIRCNPCNPFQLLVKKNHKKNTKEPKGIGGWLILFAIVLFITPIRLIIIVYTDTLPLYQNGVWDLVTTPGSVFYHPLWAPLLIFEIVGNIFFIICSLFLIYLFLIKSYRFPKLFIIFLISNIIFLLGDFFFSGFNSYNS